MILLSFTPSTSPPFTSNDVLRFSELHDEDRGLQDPHKRRPSDPQPFLQYFVPVLCPPPSPFLFHFFQLTELLQSTDANGPDQVYFFFS